MLEKIGVELPMAGPAEARRLCQRAQLILDVFAPKGQSPVPTFPNRGVPAGIGST